MTEDQFGTFCKRFDPTNHPAVKSLTIIDYRAAIDLLAGLDPMSRQLALNIHKRLKPGDTRLKQFIAILHDHTVFFCGAFFRTPKQQGSARHIATMLFLVSDESGCRYAAEQAALHRERYHDVIHELGAFEVHPNPNN